MMIDGSAPSFVVSFDYGTWRGTGCCEGTSAVFARAGSLHVVFWVQHKVGKLGMMSVGSAFRTWFSRGICDPDVWSGAGSAQVALMALTFQPQVENCFLRYIFDNKCLEGC
mmetsp:Transcript_35599/g.45999  ORF Transcript_35599/g.45999 Transcript_35599/m.45999 type:complete len:111 (+) Transcript_35599:234-566(+)